MTDQDCREEADLVNHVWMDVAAAESHLRMYLKHHSDASRIREIDTLLNSALERMEPVVQAAYPGLRFFRQDFTGRTDERGEATFVVEFLPGPDNAYEAPGG